MAVVVEKMTEVMKNTNRKILKQFLENKIKVKAAKYFNLCLGVGSLN